MTLGDLADLKSLSAVHQLSDSTCIIHFDMRFIRFTSKRMKDIYFVTYLGSIESNQMQMVLAKEKINMFMRGKDTDLDEIYNRFGVDYNLLSALMSREVDENGKFHIRWGEQEIA